MKVIKSARITKMPSKFGDPMPVVWVTVEGEAEERLFEFYPDEIMFSETEFVGLTKDQAITLKSLKDEEWLRSDSRDPVW